MKCGLYSFRTSQGNKCYYALSEEFARARPWYTLEREIECGRRVRLADGEMLPKPEPAPAPPPSMRGLGDAVAGAIHFLSGGTIQPCGGCEQRQEFLNKLVPFGKPT